MSEIPYAPTPKEIKGRTKFLTHKADFISVVILSVERTATRRLDLCQFHQFRSRLALKTRQPVFSHLTRNLSSNW